MPRAQCPSLFPKLSLRAPLAFLLRNHSSGCLLVPRHGYHLQAFSGCGESGPGSAGFEPPAPVCAPTHTCARPAHGPQWHCRCWAAAAAASRLAATAPDALKHLGVSSRCFLVLISEETCLLISHGRPRSEMYHQTGSLRFRHFLSKLPSPL